MSVPNYSGETLDRIKKLDRIRALGVNPFATRFDPTHQIVDITKEHPSSLPEGNTSPFRDVESIIANPNATVRVAGRVLLHRSFGKICFATISDGTAKIQVLFSRENCSINTGNHITQTLPLSAQIGSNSSGN